MTEPFTWRHVLYRLFNAAGELLYIGITNDLNARFSWHAGRSPWWPEVADCRTDFFPSREALRAAETQAIKAEQPRYNRASVPKPTQPKPIVPHRVCPDPRKDFDGFLDANGLRRSPKDPRFFINRCGVVLGLNPDGRLNEFVVVCRDRALAVRGPRPGHERCTDDLTGRWWWPVTPYGAMGSLSEGFSCLVPRWRPTSAAGALASTWVQR